MTRQNVLGDLILHFVSPDIQVLYNLILNMILAVTAVSNGLQAWKILEDLTNNIDIVLTEVVMPVLSGIGLLSKIMTHKTLKNIPVISKCHTVHLLFPFFFF